MSSGGPTRQSDSLADVIELVLDKGVVINADIAVSIGDTKLLGIQLRAAVASFDTAAKYGLEFPEGTDMQRVAAAAGTDEVPIDADERQAMEIDDADDATHQTAIHELDEAESTESESDSEARQPFAPKPTQESTEDENDSDSELDEMNDDTD